MNNEDLFGKTTEQHVEVLKEQKTWRDTLKRCAICQRQHVGHTDLCNSCASA